ncbi:hypothetical protein T06_1385 [Trichinella sp. T6]|nr:hypothetical protein T06_1385 [Trichinella sp. T6]
MHVQDRLVAAAAAPAPAITTTATTTPATATKKHLASSDSSLLGVTLKNLLACLNIEARNDDNAVGRSDAPENPQDKTPPTTATKHCSVPKSTRLLLSAGNVSMKCHHKQPYTTSIN